jgi:hypothetical protein
MPARRTDCTHLGRVDGYLCAEKCHAKPIRFVIVEFHLICHWRSLTIRFYCGAKQLKTNVKLTPNHLITAAKS